MWPLKLMICVLCTHTISMLHLPVLLKLFFFQCVFQWMMIVIILFYLGTECWCLFSDSHSYTLSVCLSCRCIYSTLRKRIIFTSIMLLHYLFRLGDDYISVKWNVNWMGFTMTWPCFLPLFNTQNKNGIITKNIWHPFCVDNENFYSLNAYLNAV